MRPKMKLFEAKYSNCGDIATAHAIKYYTGGYYTIGGSVQPNY